MQCFDGLYPSISSTQHHWLCSGFAMRAFVLVRSICRSSLMFVHPNSQSFVDICWCKQPVLAVILSVMFAAWLAIEILFSKLNKNCFAYLGTGHSWISLMGIESPKFLFFLSQLADLACIITDRKIGAAHSRSNTCLETWPDQRQPRVPL